MQGLEDESSFSCSIYNSIDPEDESILQQLGDRLRVDFDFKLTDKILGNNNKVVVFDDYIAGLISPNSIVALLIEEKKVIGFSFAIPIGKFDPKREDESGTTAYIYLTSIAPEKRGQKLVGPLVDFLFQELKRRGYQYVERDCLIENGYADIIRNHYNKYDCIVKSYRHNKFPEIGPEEFFRINIASYLPNRFPNQ